MYRSLHILPLTLLLGCLQTEADTGDTTAGREDISAVFDGALTATGTGTEGAWTGYRRADNSCTNAGGSYGVDCEADFTLEQDDLGALTVRVQAYDPSSSWERDDLVEILQGQALAVGTDGVAAKTHLGSGSYSWDSELVLSGDTLTMKLSGVYNNMGSCSGRKVTMYCNASWTDAGIDEILHPTLTLDAIAPGDLGIVEVMADPTACSDTHAEWIEVQNRSGSRLDLGGLRVDDRSGARSTIDTALVLDDGDVAVLSRGSVATFCDPSVHPDAGLTGTISLNNTGDDLVLYDAAGRELDRLTYPSMAGGVAWASDDAGTWCEGAPTAGTANPECAEDPVEEETAPDETAVAVAELSVGDLVVTEVMMNPNACADESCEWIEVQNTTTHTIDLSGLQIRDLANTVGTVSSSVVVSAGGYAWVGRSSSSSWAYGVAPAAWYGSTPALNNTSDQLWLVGGGRDLDATPSLSPSAGVALQRDPSTGTWCSATSVFAGSDRGTPGAVNASCK